jgi:hypothetical protein
MDLKRVPTKEAFELVAAEIGKKLLYERKLSDAQAIAILARELHDFALDTTFERRGFAIRKSVNWDRFGFVVILYVADENAEGKKTLVSFSYPEKEWGRV